MRGRRAGSLLLLNLPPHHATEAAIAASQLLPHGHPAAVQLLRRTGAVPALVAAFLEEHSHADLDPVAGEGDAEMPLLRCKPTSSCLMGKHATGLEATEGIGNILRTFPDEAQMPLSAGATLPAHEPCLANGNAAGPGSSSYGSITFHVAGAELHPERCRSIPADSQTWYVQVTSLSLSVG